MFVFFCPLLYDVYYYFVLSCIFLYVWENLFESTSKTKCLLDSGGGGGMMFLLEIIMLLFLSGSEWLWCTIHDLLAAYYGDMYIQLDR